MPVEGRKRQKVVRSLLFIIAILFIDQFSKYLIRVNLDLGESIPIIKGVLHLTLVKNTGAAFGLFKGSSTFFIWVSIVSIVVIGLVLVSSSKRLGLVLILSGALGNLIDRVQFGYVVDFIDVRIWPVFNFADTSITIGALLLIWTLTK